MIDEIVAGLVKFVQMLIDGFVAFMMWVINSIPTPQSCLDLLPTIPSIVIPIPAVQAIAWAIPVAFIIKLLSCWMMSIMTYFSIKAFLRWL
jgi:hypothetical protein